MSTKIRSLRTVKALRGESLTIDLGKTYAGTLTAWMKKDPNTETYRSFEIIQNRYLFLSKVKASDYYSLDTGLIYEKIKGKWLFDVRETPVGSVDPNEQDTIISGYINFDDNITDSSGQELVGKIVPFPEYFTELKDTPNTYTSTDANKFLKVNTAFDGVEFKALISSDITQFEQDITIASSQISDFNTLRNYIHTQAAASSTWTVTHNLQKYASVTVVDDSGIEIIGDVKYFDDNVNKIELSFTSAVSGKAYFN